MGLEEIKKLKAELDAKIKADGKKELAQEFKAFFEAQPDVEAVRWRQYTPYFNDGDACIFGVREYRAKVKGAKGDEGDYEDGFLDSWSIEDDALKTALKTLENNTSDEDVMLAVFDDHVEVTATRDGFSVEQHEHD